MATPRTGQLIWYPYLWARQQAAGETEGRKDRPCCMLLPVQRAGSKETVLYLLAVSTVPPTVRDGAIEVPEIERRRGGLSEWKARCWVYVNEYNRDVAERSLYLYPDADPIGAFGASFVNKIAVAFKAAVLARASAAVDRQD